MTDRDDDPAPENQLPDAVVETLDGLGRSELHAVAEYAQERLDEMRRPIEEDIRAETGDEIASIDDRGGYALVRKYESSPDESDPNAEITSLYLVTHERVMGGDVSLHWSFLGDVDQSK